MALFIVDIEKRLNSEFWSNVYHVEASQFSEAVVLAEGLVAAERTFHVYVVQFTKYRVRTASMLDDTYVVTPINLPGLRTVETNLLPLFNTLRIDMPASQGRPSRKFYRGVLTEGDIDGDLVTTGFAVLFVGITDNLQEIEGGPGIVGPQGERLLGTTQYPYVQMRQLRRSRRRRASGAGIFQ